MHMSHSPFNLHLTPLDAKTIPQERLSIIAFPILPSLLHAGRAETAAMKGWKGLAGINRLAGSWLVQN